MTYIFRNTSGTIQRWFRPKRYVLPLFGQTDNGAICPVCLTVVEGICICLLCVKNVYTHAHTQQALHRQLYNITRFGSLVYTYLFYIHSLYTPMSYRAPTILLYKATIIVTFGLHTPPCHTEPSPRIQTPRYVRDIPEEDRR